MMLSEGLRARRNLNSSRTFFTFTSCTAPLIGSLIQRRTGFTRSLGLKNPLLIYPRATKYEMAFSQPYIEMMGAFQSSLRAPSTTMMVLGFGFNDKHLAEPILAAIKGNLSLNVIVVDPAIEELSAKGENGYLVAPVIENDGNF